MHMHAHMCQHMHMCRHTHLAGADTVLQPVTQQARATESTQEKEKQRRETNPLRRPQECSGNSSNLGTNRITEPLKEEIPGIY